MGGKGKWILFHDVNICLFFIRFHHFLKGKNSTRQTKKRRAEPQCAVEKKEKIKKESVEFCLVYRT